MTEQDKNKENIEQEEKVEEKVEEKNYSKMTKEEIDAIKYKQEEEQEEVLDKILKGVNDVFKKDYDFKELDLKFSIALHIPNAIETGRILSLTSKLLDGDVFSVPKMYYDAFHMLATIMIVGDDIPKEFEDPEKVYNLDPLIIVRKDWLEFLNSFRY